MSLRITLATALRVARQLRRDPRTLALIRVVPCVLIWLLSEVFGADSQTFDVIAVPMLGLFPFIIMFLITSITMLRERTGGTLERLMTTPMHKFDLLAGYGLAFAGVAAVQAIVVSVVAYGLVGLDTDAPASIVVGLAVANAVCGMALGLFVSAFANSEFQAVQFMPATIFPQLLVCGLFVARDQMAGWLQALSDLMPLTYAYGALAEVSAHGGMTSTAWRDLAVVAGVTLLALALGALTLRRRTA
ncbi:MAG TPA: ABC transporter permease [Baekduia sp.]|nr:ABC transporter permease [Baekduia sp.]